MNKTNGSLRSGLIVSCLFAATLAAVAVTSLHTIVGHNTTHPLLSPARQAVLTDFEEAPVQKQATVSPITLSASLARAVPEGQPVVLTLALHNDSAQTYFIGGGAFEQSSFSIAVRDSHGSAVSRTAEGDRVLTAPRSVSWNPTILLGSGQTKRYRFDLSRLFDLSRAGAYSVSVSRRLFDQLPYLPQKSTEAAPRKQINLALDPLEVQMTESADSTSGPAPLADLAGTKTFVYFATSYSPGISRYRVGGDGSLSLALEPAAVGPAQAGKTQAVGGGPRCIATTPDGHYLYVGNPNNNTVDQYRIGDDGVLSPLSPAAVPAQKFPGSLLMDPKGKFLYALSNWGGTLYSIGPDGRLAQAVVTTADMVSKDPSHNIIPTDNNGLNGDGTILYACNGMTYAYRLAADGRPTALPAPSLSSSGSDAGRDNTIAITPSGKYAYVGVSTNNGSAFFDLVAPMRVKADGSLVPIPGAARVPQSPSSPTGYSPFQCQSLVIDPSGQFLIVVNQGYLDGFRIEADGTLTPLGMTLVPGNLTSVFFVPGIPLVYAVNSNSPTQSLLAFRMDAKKGVIPVNVDMSGDIPYGGIEASATAPVSQQWGPASRGLQVSTNLSADEFSAGRPIVLTVLLRNTTTSPISIGPANADMSSFRLSLTGPQRQSPSVLRGSGEPATSPTELLTAGRDLFLAPHGHSKTIMLPPGGMRQYRFVLTRLADLTIAGNYTIQVSRVLPGGSVAASPERKILLEGPFDGITRTIRGPGSEQELDVL